MSVCLVLWALQPEIKKWWWWWLTSIHGFFINERRDAFSIAQLVASDITAIKHEKRNPRLFIKNAPIIGASWFFNTNRIMVDNDNNVKLIPVQASQLAHSWHYKLDGSRRMSLLSRRPTVTFPAAENHKVTLFDNRGNVRDLPWVHTPTRRWNGRASNLHPLYQYGYFH